ncbi:uncharacterized protein LOC115776499 [Archocentrus centrarchus]|uniref:uncharacterized protein LOC115776499 n=1 Tax=Archocentrus centrarchus TaxID=63155 RepID=UPI0011E9FD80|nr:uncharacterized protein LOC115776499 [Archocentrus centrarchus]
MIFTQGKGQPQAVQMTYESICSVEVDSHFLKEEMLRQIPECLWSQHSTDIGYVKSAQPVKVELRPGVKLPWKSQYPLKEEAIRGIEPQIEGLLKAGVLEITQNPQSNTPLLPVKKPDNSYRLVHDLRAVNEVVADFPAEVPDLHTLLTQVPPEATHFTVLDLCGAFFSVPLSTESQSLFGFTFRGQHFVYRRLPQGFKHSPHIFNKVLKDDLEGIGQVLKSTVIQYVDDIMLCSPDAETCHKDSMKLLQILAEKGHKVSQKKLQYCQEKVVYLGQVITRGHRSISHSQLEAIRKAPKPRTVREMMTFLGIAGYSSAWIEDYASLTGPLRAMIKDTGSSQLHSMLSWTSDGFVAFETIKQRLQEAPALALPDYSKNFLLYVSTSTGGKYACAVLCQPTGTGTNPQPISYYSTAYSEVEQGLPPCYRALVGVSLMYEKASAITMGYPVTILTHHSLRNLLNYGKYTLTMPRLREYHRLLEQEDVTLMRCVTTNPAESLPTLEDGEPHDCVREAEKYSRLRSDLQALPLRETDLELWTDGSCYRVGDKLSAGYAVVKAQGLDFVVEKAEVIPQPASAQLAELVALTEACLLAEGKRVTIYTDSAYAHNVCHLFGAVWKSRGFRKTDGSPIRHHEQIIKLLQAMMKPKEIAIAKCAAHKADMSRVTQGNKAADEAAKAVTGANKVGEVFLVTHEVDLEDKITLRDVILMQEAVPDLDKQLWLDRGVTQDSMGLWRNHEGLIVAPPDLLGLMIQEAHGLAHVARGEVKRKIIKEYGFWAPCLLEQIDYVIGRCVICLKNNVRRGVTVLPGHIPTPRGPMRELVVDFVDMIKPVEGKRYMLVVVDRFSRWPEACPTKRKDAQSVANFLCKEVISRWGFPDRIASDNGKEFVDKTVKLILKKLGIKQRFGAVYHPQSQGICERMNGVLKNRVVKICQHKPKNVTEMFQVTFKIPFQKQSKTVSVKHQLLPGNVTIGNFKDIWWVCGDKAYLFLPYGWTGCCYMATLKLPYEVFTMQRGEAPNKNQSNEIWGNRRKRELAQFHNLESYHWRINLGEKWGIGIFPWYGVVFLADHIDNITYTLQGFANETIKGFQLLSNTQRSHRLTLLKHDMALDYILAKQGGLCMTLNLTGEACYTLIPDSSDNITSVIDALRHIRDAFGPSEGAGWSANAWLQDKLGPMGAILVQILIAVILSLCVMFCFCTVLLTFAKAMILRWVGIVMPSDRTQMPLIQTTDMDEEEDVVIGGVVERYPF